MSLSVKVARSRNTGRAMPGMGDPGVFGFIGSAISKVASVAKNIPGPIGWGAGAISGLTRSQARPQFIRDMPISESAKRAYEERQFGPQMPQMPRPGIVAAVQRFAPGGETGMMDAPAIGSPAGYHVNKTAYFLKDGTFIPEGSRWVKNRRRNPLNPRAASKAIGRLESLKKATARFSRITIRKKCCKK